MQTPQQNAAQLSADIDADLNFHDAMIRYTERAIRRAEYELRMRYTTERSTKLQSLRDSLARQHATDTRNR